MQPILRQPALRDLEKRHAHASPSLMERAGAAAAAWIEARYATAAAVLILAGPGNNGGDGFVLARLLRTAGYTIKVLFAGEIAHLPAPAAAAATAYQNTGGIWQAGLGREATQSFAQYALIVDALFGVGLSRPPQAPYADWIQHANASGKPILALDVPSGLDAESGLVKTPAIRASHTLSFIAHKPGLFMNDGPDYAGRCFVDRLQIDWSSRSHDETKSASEYGMLVAPAAWQTQLPVRKHNSHKGSYGSVGIIGGAPGMVGAGLLAARAALHLGAGRVYAHLLQALTVDFVQPELMLRPLADTLKLADVLAIGPGLGQGEVAHACLQAAIASAKPLLLDADALNMLAAHPALGRAVARRKAATLLTPHPAEAARLLAMTTTEVQADRIACAMRLAHQWRATVILKGCGSVVATATDWAINPTGNAGLASAGTGDVLTGILAAMLAQGMPPQTAALCAAYVHGAAADQLVAESSGPAGLTATELIIVARRLFNHPFTDAANIKA